MIENKVPRLNPPKDQNARRIFLNVISTRKGGPSTMAIGGEELRLTMENAAKRRKMEVMRAAPGAIKTAYYIASDVTVLLLDMLRKGSRN